MADTEKLMAVPDFEPIDYELLLLVKHWERVALDIRFFWFLWAQVSRTETRQLLLAKHRINRIAQAIGDDVLRKAVDEVWERYGRKVDPREWDIFLRGDRKDLDAYQDEVQEMTQPEWMRSGHDPVS
jgi:hypothetical protein